MDLKTYSGNSDDNHINGDLEMDPAMHDMQVDASDIGPVIAALKELFEMRPADDLNHPEIFSNQRSFYDSDGKLSELARIKNAKSLIKLFTEIDQSSVEIIITDGVMDIRFKLTSGLSGALKL